MLLLFVATLLLASSACAQSGCEVHINGGLPDIQPLVINPAGSTDILGYFLPQTGDVVSLPVGQEVLLACPGNSVALTGEPETLVTCVTGTSFRLPDQTVRDFTELGCTAPATTSSRDMGRLCGQPVEQYPIYAIGFRLSTGAFYKTLEICYDFATSDTLYSLLLQTPEIRGLQLDYPAPAEFQQGEGFYPEEFNLTALYSVEGQVATLTQTLGSADLANFYVNQSTDHYLTPGHLSSELDLVYGAHQTATYWFPNAAPQWQTMNNANWKALEQDLREYAGNRSGPLMIFSGTHGVITLPDVNGVAQPIHLAPGGYVRVPLMLWKVAYDPYTMRGVALAAYNNPYEPQPGPDFYVCANVCDQVSWVHSWQPGNQSAGFAYCCEVDEFYTTVLECPDLTYTGLLTD